MHLLACVLGFSLERALETETESPLARRLADANETSPLPSPPPPPPSPPPPPPTEELLVAAWVFFLFALVLALLLCFGLYYPCRSRGHGAYVAYWCCCWPDPWVEERCCDDWDCKGCSQRARQQEAALPPVMLAEPPPCR